MYWSLLFAQFRLRRGTLDMHILAGVRRKAGRIGQLDTGGPRIKVPAGASEGGLVLDPSPCRHREGSLRGPSSRWPKFDRVWADVDRFGADFDQFRPLFAWLRPSLDRFGHAMGEVDQTWGLHPSSVTQKCAFSPPRKQRCPSLCSPGEHNVPATGYRSASGRAPA